MTCLSLKSRFLDRASARTFASSSPCSRLVRPLGPKPVSRCLPHDSVTFSKESGFMMKVRPSNCMVIVSFVGFQILMLIVVLLLHQGENRIFYNPLAARSVGLPGELTSLRPKPLPCLDRTGKAELCFPPSATRAAAFCSWILSSFVMFRIFSFCFSLASRRYFSM